MPLSLSLISLLWNQVLLLTNPPGSGKWLTVEILSVFYLQACYPTNKQTPQLSLIDLRKIYKQTQNVIEIEQMGKAAKWLRRMLSGKKEKEEKWGPETRSGPRPMPPAAAKEKKRWSFRRSVTGTAMEHKSAHVRVHVGRHSDSDMVAKQPTTTAEGMDAAIRLTATRRIGDSEI